MPVIPAPLSSRLIAYRGVILVAVLAPVSIWLPALWVLLGGALVMLGLEVALARRANAQRTRSEGVIESAVDHLPGVFIVIAPDLTVRRWNDGFRSVSGYTTAAVKGQSITSFFDESDRTTVEDAFDAVLSGGTQRFEATLMTQGGRRVPVRVTGTQVTGSNGPVIVATAINMLEQKRTETALEQQEHQYRLLAENISDVVTLLDRNGRRLYVSPSIKDLVGRHPERLFGTLPFDHIHPSDVARIKDTFTFALEGTGEVRTEYRLQHEDGHYIWVESIGRATDNDQGEAALLVVTRDVTTRKKREDDLVESRERLSLQKRRLRLLYDVISRQDRPTDEQLQRVLDLGTDLLGVDVGIVSRIRDDVSTIEASTANGEYAVGNVYDVADTYSAFTVEQDEVVAIGNMGDSPHADEACYERFSLDQFLGAPIYIDGSLYGTLTFASKRPRSRPFTTDDCDFLQALVQWVRAALKARVQERALADSQRLLEKTEEVANVGGWMYEDRTQNFTHTDHLATIFEVADGYRFHPDDGPHFFGEAAWTRVLRNMHRAYEEGRPFDIAVPAITGEGRRRWLRVTCEVERGSDRPDRIWGTVQDITDRREVEDELRVTAQRLGALLTSLHEGVLVEDQNRLVRLVNQPFCDLFDISEDPTDLIGSDARQLALQSTRVLNSPEETLDRLRDLMRTRETTVGERVELADGRVLECDYVPIHIDGTRFGHLWKYRDVTLREEREAKLRSAKEAADEARDEARRAERLKSIFLANMSHEIRTPLTSIIGFAEVLEEEVPDPYDHLAGLVGTSGRRLLNTISSVLDLSKLEADRWKLDAETIDVVDEIEEALEVYRPRAEERDLDLSVDAANAPLLARADHPALQRVLDNLVGNALKFTPEGGRVTLRARTGSDAVRIAVEDTGPGISEEMQKHLFEPFVQDPDERSETATGSGLGLAITRRLVNAMDGSIELDMSYDSGTRFVIQLPVSVNAEKTAVSPENGQQSPNRVMEDEA
ncbi:MAG: PAS domain S-box protein [Bacteroidetes bacterium]|jgi:PAS domain S-box-containing protein|nr:PAS domain S-box protein [Bacteroidota bacterium]